MNASLFVTIAMNLFLIVDPIGCMPLFASITRDTAQRDRLRMIRRAILIAFLVLASFSLVGKAVLDYFGVGLPAVRIAGGVLLFMIGLEMLYGRVSRTETTEREEEEATLKGDVSVTPLAIPFLAGPGSIAAVVLFAGTVEGPAGMAGLIGALAAVMVACWILLSFTERLIGLFGQIGIRVIARVMGLLLLFVAVQFVIDGMAAVGLLGSGE